MPYDSLMVIPHPQCINKLGFTMNHSDECVVNKTISNMQCTIAFHVDDLKILHDDEKVITNIIEELNKRFGDIVPL